MLIMVFWCAWLISSACFHMRGMPFVRNKCSCMTLCGVGMYVRITRCHMVLCACRMYLRESSCGCYAVLEADSQIYGSTVTVTEQISRSRSRSQSKYPVTVTVAVTQQVSRSWSRSRPRSRSQSKDHGHRYWRESARLLLMSFLLFLHAWWCMRI